MSTSSPKKRPGSVGSDSSLTDLTELEDDAMDVDAPDDVAAGPSSKVNGLKAKDHAAERGSLAAPDRKLKRSSADADLEDDERERDIALKKQKLSKTVNREYPHEQSDMRKSIREPPSRSATARLKPGSIVPPPLSLAPNGGGTTGAKGSRAASTDIDSPLSDLSPASSRMSTPHIYRGPPKPQPGKRAKTKQSYVITPHLLCTKTIKQYLLLHQRSLCSSAPCLFTVFHAFPPAVRGKPHNHTRKNARRILTNNSTLGQKRSSWEATVACLSQVAQGRQAQLGMMTMKW